MLKIGNLHLENNIILAPMEAVNCYAFRMLCKEMGAGMVSSPMVWVPRLLENPEQQLAILGFKEKERPLSIQLGGADSEQMKRATELVERYADVIDLNCGCPKPDILGQKSGSFFIKHPEQLKKIVPPVMAATNKPVTAKIRIGWDEQSQNTLQVVKILEDFGVAAICIHARFTKQSYTGKAKWSEIRAAKEAANVPIIGNGDVFLPGNAKALIEQTKCDGVMVARGAMGNPLIFKRTRHLFETGKNMPESTDDDRKKAFMRFMKLYEEQEKQSFTELRQHALWFTRDMSTAAAMRTRLAQAKTAEDILKIYTKERLERRERAAGYDDRWIDSQAEQRWSYSEKKISYDRPQRTYPRQNYRYEDRARSSQAFRSDGYREREERPRERSYSEWSAKHSGKPAKPKRFKRKY